MRPSGEREHVVEVAAGGGTLGGPVGDAERGPTDALGNRGQQRGLQRTDVLTQLAALLAKDAVAARAHR